MERIISNKDLDCYLCLKEVLYNLELTNKKYWWLISDFEYLPKKKKTTKLMNREVLLMTTSELVKILKYDDFQWIWAVFSVIPIKYSREEILKYNFPYIQDFEEGEFNPYFDEPKLQHPLAEFELYVDDSSSMFIITDNEKLIEKFKQKYPLFITKYE